MGGRAIQSHLLTLFALTPELTVRMVMVWQLARTCFFMAAIWHLVFNMLTLWMFGSPLEGDWGTRRFLKYYFICGIGAGLLRCRR